MICGPTIRRCPRDPGCKTEIRHPFSQADFPVVVPVTETSALYEAKYCEIMAWCEAEGIAYGCRGLGIETEFHFRDTRDATAFKLRWL